MITEYKLSQIQVYQDNILKIQNEINKLEDKQAFSDKVVNEWHNNKFAQLKTIEEHFEYWLKWREEYMDCLQDNLAAEKAILEGMLK